MHVLAIDPGCSHSALIEFDEKPRLLMYEENEAICSFLRDKSVWRAHMPPLIIEQIQSYGMAVGAEVFRTCEWGGIFAEAYGRSRRTDLVHWMPRKDVKMHLCGSPRANDGNIRAAILDRFGGRQAAMGRKQSPGPLHGIAKDLWAALAVALTYSDLHSKEYTDGFFKSSSVGD